MKLFLLYAPPDAAWAQELAQRLGADGHNVYLEPPDSSPDDPSIRQKTAAALYTATMMLAVVSKESALGESAPVFEAWWRPFLQSGRLVIACIAPDAPAGAEHWMPYDLFRQPHADFHQPDGYGQLVNHLGQAKAARGPARAMPVNESDELIADAMSSRAIPDARTAQTQAQPRPSRPVPRPPELKKRAPKDLSPLPETEPPKPSVLRSLRNLIGVALGLSIVLLVLAAATQAAGSGNVTAGQWLLALLAGLAALVLIGRLTLLRRRRRLRVEQRRIAARQRAEARSPFGPQRPAVYLEVLESGAEDEAGQIWPVDDFALTVGRGANVDMPLRDRRIGKLHCVIFYNDEDGRFYLENLTDRQRTVLYERPLWRGEMMAIDNGDLIMLGKSVVLQFRVGEKG